MTPLDLLDRATWPTSVRELLATNRDTLKQHWDASQEHDREIERGRTSKYVPWRNPFEHNRDELIEQLKNALSDEYLVGHHCTRLHSEEIEDVARNGMRPLSASHAIERITRREQAGDLSPALAKALRANHQAGEDNRATMIWFVFGCSPLSDPSGIWRLLMFWGGEAVYNADPDGDASKNLAIGEPCVIEAAIAVADLNDRWRLCECLLEDEMRGSGVPLQTEQGFESFTRKHVPARQVLRILRQSDSDFERLTRWSTWAHAPPR